MSTTYIRNAYIHTYIHTYIQLNEREMLMTTTMMMRSKKIEEGWDTQGEDHMIPSGKRSEECGNDKRRRERVIINRIVGRDAHSLVSTGTFL